mgnify:CR=1 FL=1
MKTTLIIMAAGIGSRFGTGIKQLAKMSPNGEIIMDYSIYDAKEAGFDKVVFIIRKDIEEEFRSVIGNRIGDQIEVEYVYQDLADIPAGFEVPEGRTKPWGTGQAVLCCKDVVKEPFVIINADDYYGKEAYAEAFRYLTAEKEQSEKQKLCMVGFVLKNTLSENGGVTRGICKVDEQGMLTDIVETHQIEMVPEGATVRTEEGMQPIDIDSPVSMNMWGLTPEFFHILEEGFEEFLSQIPESDLKAEYLLPTIIGELLKEQKVEVKVLKSHDKWFGVTYKEDKEAVVEAIRSLVANGVYPEKLFG